MNTKPNGKRTIHANVAKYSTPKGSYDAAEERLDSGRTFAFAVPTDLTAAETREVVQCLYGLIEALECHAPEESS